VSTSRREFLLQLGAAGVALGASEALTGCIAVRRSPNIVLIFTDDQGYGDVGVYGAQGFTTPHLDRLAAEGMRFTDFYASQGVCSASRASLLTGCYAERVSIRGALGPNAPVGLHPDETTIAELLKPLGYATAAFGKWHLGDAPEFLPLHHGFDEYFGLPYSNDMWPVDYDGNPAVTGNKAAYPPLPLVEGDQTLEIVDDLSEQDQLTTRYAARAVDFIDRNADRPFFLYLAHSMPHVPLGVSQRFRGASEQGMYGDVIEEIDWSVGQVLDALDRHELVAETLVIYTSDNGPWLNYGNHAGSTGGLREGKGTAFEGGPRVPAIMRWPGRISAGSVSHRLASTIDILPTVAAITGAELPGRLIDGVNILPLLEGDDAAAARDVFLYYYLGELRAVREGRWKRVFEHVTRSYVGVEPGKDGHPGPYAFPRVPNALYDLESDVAETTDVSDEHPDIVARLDAIAEEARATLGDRLTERKGSEVREPGRVRFERPDTLAHSAVGASVTLAVGPDPQYASAGTGVLTNGRMGTRDFGDGEWLGFQGRDLDAVVDLGTPRQVRRIGLDCMQDQRPWIFFPRAVEFSVSEDGERWKVVGRREQPVERSTEVLTRVFAVPVEGGPARYVRIIARGVDLLPEWHAGAGSPAWLFADEIIVEE
jgi:arylsulfatase A-like enzyme